MFPGEGIGAGDLELLPDEGLFDGAEGGVSAEAAFEWEQEESK